MRGSLLGCQRYVFGLVLAGCAAAPPPPVAGPPRDLEGEKQLSAVEGDHDATVAKLAAVPEHDRELCEFRVGDCEIVVKDQRDELMESADLSECRVMPDSAGVMRCVSEGMVKRRKQGVLASYYSSDLSCMKTVLSCTDELGKTAEDAAVMARAGTREEDLRKVARGAAAMNTMAAADDEVAYLRATLPPSQTSACEGGDALEHCTHEANAVEDRFEAELAKDDFHPDAALTLLEQFAKAHAACIEPQLSCLSTTLESHGLYPEAKKWVTKNFETLEHREEAGAAVPPGARSRCINQASKAHQSKIVGAYVAYSRESVLFFRMQLDKAFLAMHESQLACLRSHASPGARTASSK